MRRLLVVEDEAGIRDSLVDFFAAREFVVDAAPSAERAHELWSAQGYSAVLLDLRLPGRDGLELLREMRQAGDRTPVLILTARGEEEQRIRGLECGADDYVVKPFSARELCARVEAVLRRSAEPAVKVRLGEAVVDLAAHEVERAGVVYRLLTKEVELLGFLLRNPGRVLTRAEILREVWGYQSFPTTRTVDTHVFNLRRKLEPTPEKPSHLLTVHGVGYRLRT